MTVAAACLNQDSLKSLLEGGGASEEIERLAGHLETCASCGETIETLLASDHLGAALLGAKVETDEPSVLTLRARLAKLRPAAVSQETTTGANTQSAASPPSIETTKDQSVSLAPPQQSDEIGRLGGYRILAELGRGGMGVVYKAEDLKLKRLVALKVMAPSLAADAAARQRFLREAVAMAAVHHDNIVVIHTVDEDNGVPFLAMEFLKGMPLDKWLKGGRKATPVQVLKLGREIAEGLAAAHERGLIHRDIKPGNIWLDSAHKGRVKILDFGLARSGTEDVHLTHSGAIVGTPAYMSPEQARSEKVDGRSDLFSLGCVLYKLCTGVMPFAGDTTMSLLMSLALDHPKPVRELNPDMPVALSDLVTRLLAKKPEERPQSAREVVQAIQAISRASASSASLDGRAAGFIPAVETKPAGINPAARSESVTVPLAPALASGKRKRRPWVIAAVAAGFLMTAIVVAIVIIIHDKDGKKIGELKLSPGVSVQIEDDEKKDDAAVAPKPTVHDNWLKQVAAMPAEKQVEAVAAKLKELNPGFDGKMAPVIEGGVVTGLDVLTDNVTNISPVRALTGLSTFGCKGGWFGRSQLTDLSPLKGMQLTTLSCDYTAVSDLSPLKGAPLTFLDCYGTKISDLLPLKGMKLTYFDCSGTLVSDLSALKEMPLTKLTGIGPNVSDLSPLKGMQLTHLDCGNAKISDLSPLIGMPLTRLSCFGTTVSNLSPLKGFPLTSLDCRNMPHLSDLSFLKNIPLKDLNCDFDPKRDAEILRSIRTLETINGKPVTEFWNDVDAAARAAKKNTDSDHKAAEWVLSIGGAVRVNEQDRTIRAGADLPPEALRLTFVDLQLTQVKDADLAHLKECKNLTYLGLYNTHIGDAGLAHLKGCESLMFLHLNGGPVSDAGLENLKDLRNLKEINLTGNKVTAAGVKKLAAALPKCQIKWDGGVVEPHS